MALRWFTDCLTEIVVRDEDLAGQIRYELTGDGLAPVFFSIDERTGAIYVREGSRLRDDRATNYTVR